MAGFFLTTAALRVTLLWEDSPLTNHVRKSPVDECWVSPLSHAILEDEFVADTEVATTTRKLGLRAAREHAHGLKRNYAFQYPYPDARAIDLWSGIRSLEVVIPAYEDGIAKLAEQQVGPDELLVFATAAANLKPLLGPAPTDSVVLSFLKKYGIEFVPPSTYLG